MEYSVLQIGDYIIENSLKDNVRFNNSQLNLICFTLNIISMIERDKELMSSSFVPWDYGPINPGLYNEYSNQLGGISHLVEHTEIKVDFESNDVNIYKIVWDDIADEDKQFINKYTRILQKINFFDFVEILHKDPEWSPNDRHHKYNTRTSAKYWKHHQFWKDVE